MEFLCFQNGYLNNRVEIIHGLGNRGPKANMTEKLNQGNARAGRNKNNSTTTNDDVIMM